MKTKEVSGVSVQMLLDCDRSNETYPVTPNAGCGGGLANTSFHDLEQAGTALVSAESYPYTGKNQPCKVPSSGVLPWAQVIAHNPLSGEEDEIAAALVQYGPLAASLDARAMLGYKGGVQTLGSSSAMVPI